VGGRGKNIRPWGTLQEKKKNRLAAGRRFHRGTRVKKISHLVENTERGEVRALRQAAGNNVRKKGVPGGRRRVGTTEERGRWRVKGGKT